MGLYPTNLFPIINIVAMDILEYVLKSKCWYFYGIGSWEWDCRTEEQV